jgi:hypothetical protein
LLHSQLSTSKIVARRDSKKTSKFRHNPAKQVVLQT